MNDRYDAVVIGLGIMGSASLWRLATAGAKVLGVEAFGPRHGMGSSHGATRIFRRAYWEGEKYLPLLAQADSLWSALETDSKTPLCIRSGGLFVGPRATGMVERSARTARAGGIAHELWDHAMLAARAPAFAAATDLHAVFEPGAYAVAAEQSRLCMLDQAVRRSTVVWYGDAAVAVEPAADGIRIPLRSGRTLRADSVVVTTGPWHMQGFIEELAAHVQPRQVPIYWFAPEAGAEHLFDASRFPVFLFELEDGGLLYGTPSIGSIEPGVKIGFHNRQQRPASLGEGPGVVSAADEQEISRRVQQVFPRLQPRPTRSATCIYTMTADESFIIGTARAHPRIHYASACSGHGFKFAPAIGDALARLAQGQAPDVDVRPFSVDRLC
ncbi:Monomeric sarcosine oxidase [Bordetella ansorpii]|uniref:Monomeric sarcosine oxidase n=1 Tax=Bordetella ansorpii TaxID=288768 RepID=A0A157SFC2_9BORD|nr:N-methyl-L-tryptophan oxidase [Bordetella ansorpii]SAI68921.1 Monomeric sarcosine oxidase [Bordetella ansorpii]